MTSYYTLLLLSTASVCITTAAPVSKLKGILSPKDREHINSKLSQLRQLLNDLEKEETGVVSEGEMREELIAPPKKTSDLTSSEELLVDKSNVDKSDVEENVKILKAVNHDRDDVLGDAAEQTDRGNDKDEGSTQQKDAAMKAFLDSLPDESVRDLEVLRKLEETEDSDKKDTSNDKTDTGYIDHALTDSEEKEANWRSIVRSLETQRDRLLLQKQIQHKGPEERKVKTHTVEGGFGNFKGEVKAAVEKNLLSDVALAIHSGISIDEIIQDILGQNKAANM